MTTIAPAAASSVGRPTRRAQRFHHGAQRLETPAVGDPDLATSP
jgi:hypothetical protein